MCPWAHHRENAYGHTIEKPLKNYYTALNVVSDSNDDLKVFVKICFGVLEFLRNNIVQN